MANSKIKTVSIDTANCIGCGACISICSDVFKFNDDMKSFIYNQPKNNEQLIMTQQAKDACPINIIKIQN